MTDTAVLAPVQTGTVLAAVASARELKTKERIVGLRSAKSLAVPSLMHTAHGEAVHTRWCPSTLAVWDAIHTWDGTGWLVVLTDRDEADLGAGTLARFAQHRLRRPDPWDIVKQRFGAGTLDRALLTEGKGSELADGLIKAEPTEPGPNGRPAGWPQVPAGVLTRDAALSTVAQRRLGLPDGTLDAHAVIEWTTGHDVLTRMSDLRADAGDLLTDTVIGWLAERTGSAAPIVRHLLSTGAAADVMPLGCAVHHLQNPNTPVQQTPMVMTALARLEHRLGPSRPSTAALQGFGNVAVEVARSLLSRPQTTRGARRALHHAERLLHEAGASEIVTRSSLLPGSLTETYRHLARSLGIDPHAVESAWETVRNHPLSQGVAGHDSDDRWRPVEAAVRLDRWLRQGDDAAPDPSDSARAAALARRHVQDGGWAETALNTVERGVADEELALALGQQAERVLTRRRELDHAFADAIAPVASGHDMPTSDDGTVMYLEQVLSDVAVPIAREKPLLVLLLDGMGAASGAQVVHDLVADDGSWTELLPAAARGRGTALAVLPSLTEHSRTSFFAGRLLSGGQSQERTEFAQIAARGGVAGSALFHLGSLESRAAGFVLADDVRGGLRDTDDRPLVACVLNTIDNALDRSDPGGTDWTDDTVKHLRPLLAAARDAGRAVLLVGDHGHVVERRRRTEKLDGTETSARSRQVDNPARDGEVQVKGPRVLPDGEAVLTVDEDIRYTSRKAGYHGGASLAEVAVPLVVLVPTPADASDEGFRAVCPTGWEAAPSQEPLWWNTALDAASRAPAPPAPAKSTDEETPPTLFDTVDDAAAERSTAGGIGAAVIATRTYAEQKALAPRARLRDDNVAALVDALVMAPANRLPLPAVSSLLGVAPSRINGAITVLTTVLNVEGYAVVIRDGDLLVLDPSLLEDQFGVRR